MVRAAALANPDPMAWPNNDWLRRVHGDFQAARACALALMLALWPTGGEAACRHALALGLDVSGSVNAREYQLQRRGLASALTSPRVTEVLLRHPDAPVRIAVFEFSGPDHQAMVQPWTELTLDTLPQVASRLSTLPRISAPPTTAVGSAMLTGVRLLNGQPDSWRHTLDLSADGEANTGPRPQDLNNLPPHVTINALVIGGDDQINRDKRAQGIKELSSYYSA